MLWMIAIILSLLWALGLATDTLLDGYIHVFVVVALLLLLAQIVKGPRLAPRKR